MKNFVIIGVSGYIAPRHIDAIKNTNNNLTACVDLKINSNEIKKIFPNTECFSSFELFSQYVESNKGNIDYIVICSPNYLHYDHCVWALKQGIDVICEKPLTLNYRELDILEELERKHEARLWSILQLRLHESILKLKDKYSDLTNKSDMTVDLTYITPRNVDYLKTWKGDIEKSGGVLFNIGLHFFDMLLHIFGELKSNEVHHKEPHVLSGVISFKFVTVRWFLSILDKHSPYYLEKKDNLTFRSIVFDGKELNFSSGFDKLHTFAYEKILIGKGYGISQNRAVMKLLEEINTKSTTKPTHTFHPFMDIL